MGGYATFKEKGKAPITSEQIGPGQIEIQHLSPGLFAEFRQIQLHTHSGVKSRKVKWDDLDGFIGKNGFVMYSSDGTKKYRVTINSATGAFVLTEI